MAKYEPITEFLDRQPTDKNSIGMSLTRFEEILGSRLPSSARTDRTWWGNTTNRTRVQAHAWLAASWAVDHIDLANELVTFVRHRS